MATFNIKDQTVGFQINTGNLSTSHYTRYPSKGVIIIMAVDVIDGEELDTYITLTGEFAVSGSQREEFVKKLGALIDEYRI